VVRDRQATKNARLPHPPESYRWLPPALPPPRETGAEAEAAAPALGAYEPVEPDEVEWDEAAAMVPEYPEDVAPTERYPGLPSKPLL
jgi:hypothetical protein